MKYRNGTWYDPKREIAALREKVATLEAANAEMGVTIGRLQSDVKSARQHADTNYDKWQAAESSATEHELHALGLDRQLKQKRADYIALELERDALQAELAALKATIHEAQLMLIGMSDKNAVTTWKLLSDLFARSVANTPSNADDPTRTPGGLTPLSAPPPMYGADEPGMG